MLVYYCNFWVIMFWNSCFSLEILSIQSHDTRSNWPVEIVLTNSRSIFLLLHMERWTKMKKLIFRTPFSKYTSDSCCNAEINFLVLYCLSWTCVLHVMCVLFAFAPVVPVSIWDALHDLVPFLPFKKRGVQPWRSVTFSKVAGFKL